MNKERYQNPVIGDNIKLRLMAYNSNSKTNFTSIEKIEIYYLDPEEKTEENPNGLRLVRTIPSEDVENSEIGIYSVSFIAEKDLFTIGKYIDVWHVIVEDESTNIQNNFEIYPNLWFTTTTPIIYDFNFFLRPNRIKRGSKRWLTVEIVPNVPNTNVLTEYYQNLAIISNVKIKIDQECVPCMPEECDLRTVVDNELLEIREKCNAYYFLDTTENALDLKEGMYSVIFEMEFGDSIFISEKQSLQIF